MPLASLANLLSSVIADRVVIDRTGLSGNFDLELEYAQTSAALGAGSQPSIFTAVEEQLGLKLRPERGPVEVVVIDHVEQPTPD